MKKYIIITILILGILTGGIFTPKDFNSKEEIIFQIEKGQSSKEIALNLKKEGLIRWEPFFRIYVLTRGIAGKLQTGYYLLSPLMNIPEIARKFSEGEVIKEKITIIEGWNLRNIGFYFENKGIYQAEELWELVGFPLDSQSQEGYLFPDTYEITYGMELEKIIETMTNNFSKKTADLKITSEIIIVASLLEKEVRTKEDKEIASGIFWKRLEIAKPLESCATIAYIKGVDQWRYSYQDTRIESPYNTYLNLGLPPGPICNPGLESILAALYPKSSDYWYYLSTPEGETIFSKTLEEHNIAKSKYLK